MSRNLTLAAIAIAIVAAVTALEIVDPFNGDDDGPVETEVTTVEPRIASGEELAGIAEDSGHAIYWLGEREGEQIELTEVGDGRVYVRYLPEGAEAGDPQPSYITIGSFQSSEALSRMDLLASHPRSVQEETETGRIVVDPVGQRFRAYAVDPEHPDIQVEVFHPEAGEAVRLLLEGTVEPVE